jgi:nitroreductase
MVTHPKIAATDHDVLDVIRSRWSPRAFDAARFVTLDEQLRLFEAARWAPSSGNEQPWRFLVGDRFRQPSAFDRMLESLNETNRGWAHHAPLLVLAIAATSLTRTGAANRHAWYDTGQAVALLTMQATSMGLSMRQMEGFDRERAREACGVESGFEPVTMLAIGYPGDPAGLANEKHRELETKPRARKAVEEFVSWLE